MQLAAGWRWRALRWRSPAWLAGMAEATTRWAAGERGRFALWLPVFMAAGVIGFFALRRDPPAWAAAAPLCALLPLLAIRVRVCRASIWAAVAACVGFGSAQFATWRAPPPLDLPRRAVVITGIVRGVEMLPQGQRVVLEAPHLADGPPLPRRLRIRLRGDETRDVATGDVIRVRAMVRPPAPPAYPGAWDLQRDAYFSGIGGYGYALGRIETLAAAPPGPMRAVLALREAIAARVAAALPGESGPVAQTLLSGLSTAIKPDVRAAFRDSGLAHLLAIAGLHIGIVMGLFLGASRVLLALSEHAALHWRCKQIAVLIALAAGGAYMILTGAHVPIIRSFSMACLVALGVLTGRRALSLRGLALAATVLMLIAPAEVLGVSFQMSFSAVLALIAGYDVLRPVLGRLRGHGGPWRSFLGHLAALALTSALAGTASAPFGAYHFGRIQLYYIVANMAAVPLTAMWVMPLGLIALALMPLHLEWLALAPMGWGISAIIWIGRTVSALPAATLAVPHPPAWGLLATSLGIAWLGLWRTRWRLAGVAGIALGLASPALERPPDILVSADARLIGLRGRAAMFVETRAGGEDFTLDSWQQYWAAPRVIAMPGDGGASAGGEVACEGGACTLRGMNGGAAVLLRRAASRADCAAAVLVSAEPIRLRCGFWMEWVDRFSVWRDGAHAIWLAPDGLRILSDRDARGMRPWVPPPPLPRGR